MDAKDYLRQIDAINEALRQEQYRYRELEAAKKGLPAGASSSDKVTSSPDGNAPFTKISEMQEECREEIVRLWGLKNRIIKEIQSEAPLHREILFRVYVEHQKIFEIAMDPRWGRSYDRTRHIHADALKEFEKRHIIAHLL